MRAQSPIATAPSATTDGRITELHLWAVREGLRRAPAATLFADFCRCWLLPGCRFGALSSGCERYIHNGPGYTYTWWRDRDLVQPVRRERGEEYDQDLRDSPFLYLLNAAWLRYRRGGVPISGHGSTPRLGTAVLARSSVPASCSDIMQRKWNSERGLGISGIPAVTDLVRRGARGICPKRARREARRNSPSSGVTICAGQDPLSG
jgi:hypothetical protein